MRADRQTTAAPTPGGMPGQREADATLHVEELAPGEGRAVLLAVAVLAEPRTDGILALDGFIRSDGTKGGEHLASLHGGVPSGRALVRGSRRQHGAWLVTTMRSRTCYNRPRIVDPVPVYARVNRTSCRDGGRRRPSSPDWDPPSGGGYGSAMGPRTPGTSHPGTDRGLPIPEPLCHTWPGLDAGPTRADWHPAQPSYGHCGRRCTREHRSPEALSSLPAWAGRGRTRRGEGSCTLV